MCPPYKTLITISCNFQNDGASQCLLWCTTLSCWVYLQVPRKLTLHSLVMEQLLSLDLIPPSSVADIPKVLQELHAKKVLCAFVYSSLSIVWSIVYRSLFFGSLSIVHCLLFIVHCHCHRHCLCPYHSFCVWNCRCHCHYLATCAMPHCSLTHQFEFPFILTGVIW